MKLLLYCLAVTLLVSLVQAVNYDKTSSGSMDNDGISNIDGDDANSFKDDETAPFSLDKNQKKLSRDGLTDSSESIETEVLTDDSDNETLHRTFNSPPRRRNGQVVRSILKNSQVPLPSADQQTSYFREDYSPATRLRKIKQHHLDTFRRLAEQRETERRQWESEQKQRELEERRRQSELLHQQGSEQINQDKNVQGLREKLSRNALEYAADKTASIARFDRAISDKLTVGGVCLRESDACTIS